MHCNTTLQSTVTLHGQVAAMSFLHFGRIDSTAEIVRQMPTLR
jgi:hypothetical protein